MPNITGARERWTVPTTLDGPVYAEPLQCGNSLFVATENNTVYALNATSGSTLWRTHLGTPVLGSTLPCGDIEPTTGITGTPVIDVGSQTLYVVAFLNPDQHVLFALNTQNGSVRSHVGVDPAGAQPQVEQERGALALANGYVYVPYGGLAGDCGAYHGWLVGVPTNGSSALISYQVPTGREGGIWAPSGISISPAGDLYVTTGNSEATTTNDYGDTVLELSPALRVLSYFTPTNFAQLNTNDTDLGSVAPAVLPDGNLFQVGKAGIGYLLSGSNLGGIGGELYEKSVCAGGYSGTAQVGSSLLIACTDGLLRLSIGPSTFSVVWQTTSFDAGAPDRHRQYRLGRRLAFGEVARVQSLVRRTGLFLLVGGRRTLHHALGGARKRLRRRRRPGLLLRHDLTVTVPLQGLRHQLGNRGRIWPIVGRVPQPRRHRESSRGWGPRPDQRSMPGL